MSKATVTFTNTLGITVMSAELNGNQGQKVLDLSGLDSGVYMYSIRCGEYIHSGKLMITK
ncbi:MAG: T9SS type A sorting domain-containing protein [Bacteroidales bacterium]|nr:T9SS type A sorting domain-containing protein [Bacteroidales bacterium]